MRKRQVVFVRAEEVIQAVAELCRHFSAVEVILFGSRAKGTARERKEGGKKNGRRQEYVGFAYGS